MYCMHKNFEGENFCSKITLPANVFSVKFCGREYLYCRTGNLKKVFSAKKKNFAIKSHRFKRSLVYGTLAYVVYCTIRTWGS